MKDKELLYQQKLILIGMVHEHGLEEEYARIKSDIKSLYAGLNTGKEKAAFIAAVTTFLAETAESEGF